MNNEKTENWKASKRAELKRRIVMLATKITGLSQEIQRFGPRLVRKGFRTVYVQRPGQISNWEAMARQSIISLSLIHI